MLFSQEYPSFSNKELKSIKQNKGTIPFNRINHYNEKLKSIKKYSKSKQLLKTNLYLNSLLPQYDVITKSQEDYWSTPKEFLIGGFGDCEDYVIIKYYSLIKLGFDEKKLFLTIVKDKFSNSGHMVLSYFDKKGKAPLILDNLSFRILNLQKRSDLLVDIFINSRGIFRIDKNFKLKKIANKHSHYEDLLFRVSKNL